MATITAVTASPPWPNPGMASVDLALPALLRRHGIDADLRLVRLYTPVEWRVGLPEREERLARLHAFPFEYELLRGEGALAALRESDAILYWGDFLHSFDYLHQMASTLVRIGLAGDEAAAVREVYRSFYLADAPEEVLARAVAFGGTLLFNRERDYNNPDYARQLGRFVRGARGVWMRDVYSALRVADLRGPFSLGADCALLLRDEDLDLLPETGWDPGGDPGDTAGIFFGRTRADARRIGRFARDLCRKLGATPEWLPWFDSSYRPNHLPEVREAVPRLRVADDSRLPAVGDLLRRLARYRFVISDTYHVCLNAWRAGVPALCLGEASPSLYTYDVSAGWCCAWRDKRHVFLAMHDAMEFYVFQEELASRVGYANRLLYSTHLLEDRKNAEEVAARIRERSEAAERELVPAIAGLVGVPTGAPA